MKCPHCKKQMHIEGEDFSFHDDRKKYNRQIFRCHTDDIWMSLEIPVHELVPFTQTAYWEYEWGTQQTLCLLFRCEFVKQHVIKKVHHIAGIKWFTKDEIAKLDTLPGTMRVIGLI